jgi:replication protein (fragment)
MNKSKDLVKYHNDINKLKMGNLDEKELELFFALCVELKDIGEDEVKINIREFKRKYNIANKNNIRFEKYMETVVNKFLDTRIIIKTKNKLDIGNFFTRFTLDFDVNTLFVQINRSYLYLLNNLVEMYTQFNFEDYQNLKSKYAKRLMPKLSQWNGTKKIEYKKDELYEILGATESYKTDISSFNKRILKPATTELRKIFFNLKVKPIKNINKSINSYLFTWSDKPKEIIEAEEVKTIEISKKLKNLLDEATKNSKLEILEKPSVIEYLLKHYSEDIIILGIKNLLNVTTKIKTRKYIVTVLDKIKEKENIKVVVKKDKKVEAIKEEEYKPIEKIEITADDYNKLLDIEIKNYLEEAKTKNINVNNLEIIKMSLKVKLNSKYKIK